jgi:hypothetical protein
MNDELERCRNDIVYFAEKYLGYELLDWQKEALDRYLKGERIHLMGYRSGKKVLADTIERYNYKFK